MIMSSGGSNPIDTTSRTKETNGEKPESRYDDKVSAEILQALKGLQFGEVVITVRDGRVVQIDRVARNRQVLPKKA